MRRFRLVQALTATVVALALVAPAQAGGGASQALVRAVKDASVAEDPAATFLGALMGLQDFTLEGDEIRADLGNAGVQAAGPVGPVLANARTVTKRGNQIEITFSREQTFPIVSDGKTVGWVHLASRVSARLRRDGKAFVIDDQDGMEVGEKKDSLYDVKRLVFEKEKGRPVARLTAGFGIFTKTKTFDLSRATSATTVPTGGVVSGLSGRD